MKKGDPPVMGITKIGEGTTIDEIKRPWRKLALEATAARLPATIS